MGVKITVDPTKPLIGMAGIEADDQGSRVVDDKAPWIYLLASPGNNSIGSVHCDRCGTVTTLPKGINMGTFARMSDDFMKLHREC